MARVGVDIDGVLYPFDDEFRKALVRGNWRTIDQCPPVTRWEFYEDWGMDRQLFVDYCDQFTNDGNLFWQGDPYKHTPEQLWRLREAGHTIVLITNRNFGDPGVIEAATKEWLDYWNFPYDELHFVKDKRDIDVDYHIDDNVDNFKAMLGKGVESWMLRTPTNAGEWVLRNVPSLTQYVSIVLDREEKAEAERKAHPPIVAEIPPFPDTTLTLADGEVRVTSSTGGQKGKKLCRPSLMPAEALKEVAEHYGKGAKKYDDHNWRKGYDWSLSMDALERHWLDFRAGIDYDPETGSHHLAAVVFHALALLTFRREHPEFDDRFIATPPAAPR